MATQSQEIIKIIYEQKLKGELSKNSVKRLLLMKELALTNEEWELIKILIGYKS